MAKEKEITMDDGSVLETGTVYLPTDKGNIVAPYSCLNYPKDSFIKSKYTIDHFSQNLRFENNETDETYSVQYLLAREEEERTSDVLGRKMDFEINGEKATFFDVSDKTFLKMANHFPPCDGSFFQDKELETRMMAINPSKCADEKAKKDLMESLEQLSDKGYVGATLSLLNMHMDEYNAGKQTEDQRLASERKIKKLAKKAKEGCTTVQFEHALDCILDKNEKFQPLTTKLAKKVGNKLIGPSNKNGNGSVLQVTKDGVRKIELGSAVLALGVAGALALTAAPGMVVAGGALAAWLMFDRSATKELKSMAGNAKSGISEFLRQKKGRA